jgi:sulfur-carrier protein
VKIRVKLIATYLAHLPPGTQGNTVEMDAPNGATVGDVLGPLGIPLDDTSVFLLNGLQAEAEARLTDGDVVTAFSAIAGGSQRMTFGETDARMLSTDWERMRG